MDLEYTRIKPSIGRVAVKLQRQEERTKSGLYLPQQAQEVAANCGTVVAVCTTGDGDIGPSFSLGDIVVFGKYTGSKIEINDKSYVIMREEDILCTLHPNEDDTFTEAEVQRSNLDGGASASRATTGASSGDGQLHSGVRSPTTRSRKGDLDPSASGSERDASAPRRRAGDLPDRD